MFRPLRAGDDGVFEISLLGSVEVFEAASQSGDGNDGKKEGWRWW